MAPSIPQPAPPTDQFNYSTILVRPISQSFSNAQQLSSTPLNVATATEQHDRYIDTLKTLVDEVITVDPSPDHPDSNFIEDTAIAVNYTVILAQLGHESRFGEEKFVAWKLQQLRTDRAHPNLRKVLQVTDDARFDGGDILFTGSHLFVGISKRTNDVAYEQIRSFLGDSEPTVKVVKVHVKEGLHLKSCITILDKDLLVIADTLAGRSVRDEITKELGITQYQYLVVPDLPASNVLRVRQTLLIQAGYPQSEPILRQAAEERKLNVIALDMSELVKADGALTCGSLLLQIK